MFRWFCRCSALILAAYFLSNWWIVRGAEGRIHSPEGEGPQRQTVIVPGAMVWKQQPSATLRDRLQCSLSLYRQGRARRILVSGDHGQHEYNEVGAMSAWLKARGVPEEHIVVDHAGFRTWDTMLRARHVFGVKSASICTQDFHLARSLFLAKQAGIDAIGVTADRRPYAAARFNKWRERFARLVAVLDTVVLKREARFMSAIDSQLFQRGVRENSGATSRPA